MKDKILDILAVVIIMLGIVPVALAVLVSSVVMITISLIRSCYSFIKFIIRGDK